MANKKIKDQGESLVLPELNFLKLHMSAHFFFNIMNSIYHAIRINPEQAEIIVLQLSEMMKYQIYECAKEKVELGKEVQAIHNYIAIQQMRLAHKPVIQVSVKGDLQNRLISPFILIKLVENAFKYGLEKQLKDHYLDIQLEVNDSDLIFSVVNSKPAQIAGSKKSANGSGIISLKKRLNLLYPSRHTLTNQNDSEYYSIKLDLKLN